MGRSEEHESARVQIETRCWWDCVTAQKETRSFSSGSLVSLVSSGSLVSLVSLVSSGS